MEPITIILTALKAGAVTVAKVTVDEAIKDAYQNLKALILRKFAGKPKDEIALDEHEKDADTWNKPLKKALTEAAADKDQEIIEAAQHLMKLVDPQQAAVGKYNIHDIDNIVGSAIGDRASVTNKDINVGSKQSEK